MFGAKQPKERVGLVGGECYGKTVFLVKLLDLAECPNSRNPEAERLEGKSDE